MHKSFTIGKKDCYAMMLLNCKFLHVFGLVFCVSVVYSFLCFMVFRLKKEGKLLNFVNFHLMITSPGESFRKK